LKYHIINGSQEYFPWSNEKGKLLNNQIIETVLPGKSGKIWLGTASGLFCFNSTDNTFNSVVKSFDTSNSLSINTAKPLYEDGEGAIWYGTFGLGMYKIDASGERITKYSYNSSDPESLSENAINCIYQDRAGTMWFATFGAGISVFDPLAHKFELITHDPLNDNSLSSNFIWTVFEAKDGKNALEKAKSYQGTIELLFTDAVMPIMGGLELSEKIKEIYPDIQVLFASGYMDNGIHQEILTGAKGRFINKPYNIQDIMVMIRQLLDEPVSG
jgi:CheY-like chemotaxis protein